MLVEVPYMFHRFVLLLFFILLGRLFALILDKYLVLLRLEVRSLSCKRLVHTYLNGGLNYELLGWGRNKYLGLVLVTVGLL